MTTLPTTRTAIAHYTGGAVTKYQEQAVSDATKRAYANEVEETLVDYVLTLAPLVFDDHGRRVLV